MRLARSSDWKRRLLSVFPGGRTLVYEKRISGQVSVAVRVTVRHDDGAMSVSDLEHLMGSLRELVARFDRYTGERAAGREGESGGP